jgi:hypothetical protein
MLVSFGGLGICTGDTGVKIKSRRLADSAGGKYIKSNENSGYRHRSDGRVSR